MKLLKHPEIVSKLEELEKDMFDFQDDSSLVKKWHITKCMNSIIRCIERIEHSISKTNVKHSINRTVVTLNVLQILTQEDLIYTTEREDIAEILNRASILKGFSTENEDLTEKLRIW